MRLECRSGVSPGDHLRLPARYTLQQHRMLPAARSDLTSIVRGEVLGKDLQLDGLSCLTPCRHRYTCLHELSSAWQKG